MNVASNNLQQPPAPPAKTVVVRGADGQRYRRSVQVFFVNEHGQFLVCCPVGPSNRHYRQTVQGGSEFGEIPTQTAERETWEEIGLQLGQGGVFLRDAVPFRAPPLYTETAMASPSVLGTSAEDDAAGERIDDSRASFRYLSKKWRKEGIVGQELYPVLYYLPSNAIDYVSVNSKLRGVRQEFTRVYWGTLAELQQCAPPVKQEVMSHVCPAVAAAAKRFLTTNNYPLDGIAAYC